MNKELDNAVNYFKNRNSFERPVYETTQFQTILKALTPPTAEEVCEALGKCLNEFPDENEVSYDKETSEFYTFWDSQKIRICSKHKKNNEIYFYRGLQPHLITLIGRFYESVVSL